MKGPLTITRDRDEPKLINPKPSTSEDWVRIIAAGISRAYWKIFWSWVLIAICVGIVYAMLTVR